MGTGQVSDTEAQRLGPPATCQWRANRVNKALREDECANTLYGVGAPEMMDLVGQFGFEEIWLEMEHTLPVLPLVDITNVSRACGLCGIRSVFHVPSNPCVIQRVLGSGADGVAVPTVRPQEAAETIVMAPRGAMTIHPESHTLILSVCTG